MPVMPSRFAWLAAGLLGIVACASREVPASYPKSSAASPQAAPGPVQPVTRALASDPPMPGAASTGSSGLGPAPAQQGHEGHHHGH
jgi:hypothetical protein